MTNSDSPTSGAPTTGNSLLGSVSGDIRSSWKSLALNDVAFKIVALVVLTPLVGALFRILIATSGSAVLSDLDILHFFLGPVGWLCFILVGALWLGIVALEQASLMGILCARSADKRLNLRGALRFAYVNAWPVVRVTTRIVALTLLTAAPFLAVVAAVYFTLLTDYDINYYLKEKPPAFGVAVGIAAVVMAALAAVLLRLFTGWFFALPLVLFEETQPSAALRLSTERARGRRRTLLFWIVAWLVATSILSAVATGIVGLLGRLLIPGLTGSIHLLTLAIGATVLVWAVAGLGVNLLSTTTFAAILFNLYRRIGGGENARISREDIIGPAGDDAWPRMTRRRLVGAALAGIVVAVAVGALAVRTVRLEDDVKIMAHRGSSKAAPENTMAAFRKAVEEGAEWIELDVQETADGEVVVFHDADFMRFARNDLKIWDATMDDLGDIDIGSWFAPEFKDERVPTLAEVLDEFKGKARINIELKYYGHDQELEKRVVKIVESLDMASDVMVMSLNAEGNQKIKKLRPGWKVGQLMSVAVGDLKKIEADFLGVNAGFANRRIIRSAHANGMDFYVWTVNDGPTMSAMMSRGVDGILTDKPALAQKVLEQRAQMSAPERLLLELAAVLGATPEMGEL